MKERIITTTTITTGEKSDGKELETLYRKSKETGMEIDTIIGDTSYSGKGNIELAKERYKIEAKNSELKHRHGYDTASSSGLIGMEMQGALAIFTVNLKRILKLADKK